jgi:hypothetical protein
MGVAMWLMASWSASALAAEGKAGGMAYDVKGSYYETCSCAVSCPCAAMMKPTEPHCDAVMTFHIDSGKVGKVKLDGLTFITLLRSPKGAVVFESFGKGEMDLFTMYIDDKATPEQREALGKLMPALFGDKEIKGSKPPQFVPMTLDVQGDVAKLTAAGNKLTYEIENLNLGTETKAAAPKGKDAPKRIKLTNSAPFPWIADPTQGRSKAFHYDDLGTKWDYSGRNAFFSTWTSKGSIKEAAAKEAPAKEAPAKAKEAPAK